MRKALLLLSLCIGTIQAQDIEWEHSFGGRQAEYLFDLQPTADYGFIVAGSSLSQKSGNKQAGPNGDLDFWIWKMDEHGAEDWQKSFGGPGSDFLMSIRNTPDGGFILGGTTDSQSEGPSLRGPQESLSRQRRESNPVTVRTDNNYWIIKLNAKGIEQWSKIIGGIGQDDLLAVVPTRDGGYIAGGSSASGANGDKTDVSRGNMDYWIVKLDRDGKVQWQKSFGGVYADLLRALVVTEDGGYLLAGYSNSPSVTSGSSRASGSSTAPSSSTAPGPSTALGGTTGKGSDKDQDNWGTGGDYWILKLDPDGAIEWQRTLGGDKDDQLFSAIQSKDGNYLIGGSSSSSATGNKSQSNRNGSDVWLLKLDSLGNIIWQQTYDFGPADFMASIVENDDATLLIGGYAKGSGKEGVNDYIALKTDDKGEELWRRTVGSDGEDILKKAIETRDGGYVLAGTSNPENRGSRRRSKPNNSINAASLRGDSQSNLAGADKLQNEMDAAVSDASNEANHFLKEQTDKFDASEERSLGRLKVGGLLSPSPPSSGQALPLGMTNGGDNGSDTNNSAAQGPKPGLKQSRDKKANYGNRDFWVVKLKDNDKKTKDKKTIEAFPNPVVQFTNVIVGFDFTKGTLRVFDLGGRQLQSFAITERTIPVDLSAYPEGIYILSVKTDKGEGSFKVIKGIK